MTAPKRLAAAAVAWLALAASAAQAAPVAQPCVTAPEAESLFLVLAPDLIRETGKACAATLPPTALLRQPSSALLAKYDGERASAWPRARGALRKLVGPEVQPLVDSDFAQPMLVALMAPKLASDLDPSACPTIDKMLGLLQPLPARNTASLVVSILQLVQAERGTANRVPELNICPAKAS